MKVKTLLDTETNRTAYNRVARQLLRCSLCRPHRNENSTKGRHNESTTSGFKRYGVRKKKIRWDRNWFHLPWND